VSISLRFIEQLLHSQIPKAQKKTVKLSVFFMLSGSSLKKAARRMLVKLTLGFHAGNNCGKEEKFHRMA